MSDKPQRPKEAAGMLAERCSKGSALYVWFCGVAVLSLARTLERS